MASVDYPSTLPNPVQAGHAPKPRVSATDLPGAESYSQREQDYTGTLDVEFFFTAEQVPVFRAWWLNDLKRGGMAFNCFWPALRSGMMTVFFLSAPKYTHVYNGAFKVSAQVSVRGVALPVQGCRPNPYYAAPSDTLMFFSGDSLVDESPYKLTTNYAGSPTLIADAYIGSSSLNLSATSGSSSVRVQGSGSARVDNWTWQGFLKSVSQARLAGFFSWNNLLCDFLWRDPANGGTYQLAVVFNGSFVLVGTTAVPQNTWCHIAISVSLSGANYTLRIFLNGVLEGTLVTTNLSASLNEGSMGMGYYQGTGYSALGYLNQASLRSQCLYTASFTPPAAPHVPTGVAQTTNLVLHGQSVVDNSPNPKTVALTGTAAVSSAAFKYGPNSIYVPYAGATNNAGIAVTIPAHTRDFQPYYSDFFVRIWAMRLSHAYLGYLMHLPCSGSPIIVYVQTTGRIFLSCGSNGGNLPNVDTGVTWPLGRFCEFVFQRRGALYEVLLDGAVVYSVAVPGGAGAFLGLASPTFWLGRKDDGSSSWNGYVEQVVFVDNTPLTRNGSYSLDPVPICDYA